MRVTITSVTNQRHRDAGRQQSCMEWRSSAGSFLERGRCHVFEWEAQDIAVRAGPFENPRPSMLRGML
jgi:hypothetical protein